MDSFKKMVAIALAAELGFLPVVVSDSPCIRLRLYHPSIY